MIMVMMTDLKKEAIKCRNYYGVSGEKILLFNSYVSLSVFIGLQHILISIIFLSWITLSTIGRGINGYLIIGKVSSDINMLVFIIIVAYMYKLACYEVTLKFSLNWIIKNTNIAVIKKVTTCIMCHVYILINTWYASRPNNESW